MFREIHSAFRELKCSSYGLNCGVVNNRHRSPKVNLFLQWTLASVSFLRVVSTYPACVSTRCYHESTENPARRMSARCPTQRAFSAEFFPDKFQFLRQLRHFPRAKVSRENTHELFLPRFFCLYLTFIVESTSKESERRYFFCVSSLRLPRLLRPPRWDRRFIGGR